MLTKLVFTLYEEPCNCGEKIRHNIGGNYHRVEREHVIMDNDNIYCVIKEKTTTREDMPGDKYEILTFAGGEFRLEDENWVPDNEKVRIEGYQMVLFRKGEAEIVYQRPKLFIETRRPRAEKLAAEARKNGHYNVHWEDFLLVD